MDTIVALSSGALPSGVAVVRISGPGADSVFKLFDCVQPEARRAAYSVLKDPQDGSVLDRCLAIRFPAPNSFTGENVVELQLHGSRAVVARVLNVLVEQDTWRLAEAGEFTRQAFENGRMDLTSVEGLGDLLAAETEQQRKYALMQSDGALAVTLDNLRDDILSMLAVFEAALEFVDEDDVPEDGVAVIGGQLDATQHALAELLDTFDTARIVRDGFRVVLAGLPNVGKSSMLNALAGSDRAIVTAEAGTTRDLLEVEIDIGGYLVRLVDTAGVRETESAAEREGVRRTRRAVSEADMVISLRGENLEPVPGLPKDALAVWTKTDLHPGPADVINYSSETGDGTQRLLAAIEERLANLTPTGYAFVNRERHVSTLTEASQALSGARTAGLEHDIRAEHLRLAAYALGKLTGRVDPEEVLDRVFQGFCIGK